MYTTLYVTRLANIGVQFSIGSVLKETLFVCKRYGDREDAITPQYLLNFYLVKIDQKLVISHSKMMNCKPIRLKSKAFKYN